MFLSSAYAQTAPANQGGDPIQMLVMFGIIAVLMYFMMIRPQMKRQKEVRQMLDALAVGDEVVSVGGLLGTITKITDFHIVLEVANQTQIVVQRSAVITLLPRGTIKNIG